MLQSAFHWDQHADQGALLPVAVPGRGVEAVRPRPYAGGLQRRAEREASGIMVKLSEYSVVLSGSLWFSVVLSGPHWFSVVHFSFTVQPRG